LIISASQLDRQHEALLSLLKKLLELQIEIVKLKGSTKLCNSQNLIEMMILIPEATVAPIIGGKGKQIKSFMDESGAEIVVN